jgi:hypothetical protein
MTSTTSETFTHHRNLVLKTRTFGHCYVKVGDRHKFGTVDGITYSFTSYGRSLQGGGHKYKVHANYSETGKPVPTKALKAL